jgi:uncharacterized protein
MYEYMQPSISAPTNRLVSIDMLRGIALLGILLAHFIYWHTGGALPNEVYMKNYGVGSTIVTGINGLFIFGKFFTFFAFLFGVSFHIQLTGLEKSGTHVGIRFTRRLLILFLMGMVHHLFWMGDILSIYAFLGLSLIFFRFLNNNWLLICGILFALAIPNKIWDAINFLFIHREPKNDFDSAARAYYEVVKNGSLGQVIQFNFSQLMGKASFQLLGGRASATIGFFLLGIWAARVGILNGKEETRKPLGKILRKCAIACGILLLLGLGIYGVNQIFSLGWEKSPVAGFFFGILFDTFNAGLVLIYLSGFLLLFFRPFWKKIFSPLQYVGKLALTSYLLQTVAGLLLFYHFGAGWFLKTTPAINWGLAIVLFLLQVWVARWWLHRFYYGPMEWLWRSATIGKAQPFLRKK